MFSIIFLLYIKNEWGKSFTSAIRAESALRDQTGLLGHCGIQPVFLSHEYQCPTPPIPSFTVSSYIQGVCQQKIYPLLHNSLIYFPLFFVCVGGWGGVGGFNVRHSFSIRGRAALSAQGSNFGLYFMACPRQPALTPVSLQTLWDSGCIQVVMVT